MADAVPGTDRGKRRKSLGRYLEKFRAVLKGRGSGRRGAVTVAIASPLEGSSKTAEQAVEPQTLESREGGRAVIVPTNDQPAAEITCISAPLLVAGEDDDTDEEGNDEALLPMMLSGSNINEDRARRLFEKYGIPPSQSSEQEPPNKRRRVEKPVRIRIHRICHECKTAFAFDRTCASCGHRRCRQCSREPAKRVKEMLEQARELKELDDRQEITAVAAPVIASDIPPESKDEFAGAASLEHLTSTLPLEKEIDAEDDTAVISTIQTRPVPSITLTFRPKAQIIRRQCHECQTPIVPATNTKCSNCGHIRCTLCPRYPPKPEKWTAGSPGDAKPVGGEVRMVQCVQRVYRKPRQRVRFTCEQCQAVFVNTDECGQCGHERCKDCIRMP